MSQEEGPAPLQPPATTFMIEDPLGAAAESSPGADIPVHGTPEFWSLLRSDPRRQVSEILFEAACWRKFAECEYLTELLCEWVDWDRRRAEAQASTAVSICAAELAERGHRPGLTFAQIQERRKLVTILPCLGCRAEVEMVHPFLDENWDVPPIWCPTCQVQERRVAS